MTRTNESLACDLRQTAAQIEALAREAGKPVEAMPLSVVGLREAAERLEALTIYYFIGEDDSGHTYLVPRKHYDEWMAWEELQSKDPENLSDEDRDRAWTVPAYAKRIDGHRRLSFINPMEF